MYMVSPIHMTKFQDLDLFVLSGSAIGEIPKTMIFIDKIDNTI